MASSITKASTAAKGVGQITRKVVPLLSTNKAEARGRVLALYKAWWRQIPAIIQKGNVMVSEKECHLKLKEKFMANKDVRDIRVIDMLVVQGQNDLKEMIEQWAMPMHFMSKHFRESHEQRPKDFMTKFLSGHD